MQMLALSPVKPVLALSTLTTSPTSTTGLIDIIVIVGLKGILVDDAEEEEKNATKISQSIDGRPTVTESNKAKIKCRVLGSEGLEASV